MNYIDALIIALAAIGMGGAYVACQLFFEYMVWRSEKRNGK